MIGRLPCVAPGCRRTIAGEHGEWICPVHWRLVPRARKRAWARLRRIMKRYGEDAVQQDRYFRIWDRLKREAGAIILSPPKD